MPIVERKPLARALYRDVKVGRPIPWNCIARWPKFLRTSIACAAKERKTAAAPRDRRFGNSLPRARSSRGGISASLEPQPTGGVGATHAGVRR